MRRDRKLLFQFLPGLALLLCAAGAWSAWAGSDTGSVGVGITIVRATHATANVGQVDIDTRRVKTVSGTLSVTPVFAGQHLTYSLVAKPTFGTASITDTATGAFTYVPAGLYRKGVDNFTFHVVDDHGVASNTASEFVVQNLTPEAVAGSVIAPLNAPANGALIATPSYSGELLTFSIVTQAVKGLAVITDTHTGAFTYTRRIGNTGTDYFKFKVTDSAGIESNIAIESVTLQ